MLEGACAVLEGVRGFVLCVCAVNMEIRKPTQYPRQMGVVGTACLLEGVRG